MKNTFNKPKSILLGVLLLFSISSMAQQIEVNAGYGSYEPAAFSGYGDKDAAKGIFEASAGKTSGVIPPYTAIITVMLAPEVPWTGEAFTLPDGWEQIDTGDPASLAFTNSAPWTTEDPYFAIPVRAIAPRSTTDKLVGTQIMNDGGDWTDPDPLNNNVRSAVTVADINLPVTLVNFAAAKEGAVAQLAWSTSEETNSDRFEVQRSLDGKSWAQIGSVASHGESKVLRAYDFTDKAPLNGVNLYRLKMVDKDETFAYSSIKSVRFEGALSLAYVYPNPSTDRVFLNTKDLSGVKQVSVVDLNGRAVLTTKATTTGIDVKGLSAGAYVLKVSHVDGTSSQHKFVINR